MTDVRVAPPLPRIRRGHPLSQGLIVAYPTAEGTGPTTYAAVANDHDPDIAVASWVNTPFGFGVSGSSAPSNQTDNMLGVMGTLERSAALWFKCNSGGVEFFLFYGSAISGPGDSWRLSVGEVEANTFNVGISSSGAGWGPTVADSQWHHAVVTIGKGKTLQDHNVYIDGKKAAMGSSVSPTTALNTISRVFLLNQANNASAATAGVMIWNRQLSDNEAAMLYQDHFQMFRRSNLIDLYAPLYSNLDEASAPVDSDFILSPGNPSHEIVLFGLANPTAGYAVDGPLTVRYRCALDTAGSVVLGVKLKQGVTTIASWTQTVSSTTLATFEHQISAGEFASITDFNDLRVEFEAGA